VKALPTEAFAMGKRIPLWTSASAPNCVVFGTEINVLNEARCEPKLHSPPH
jgi:hypothetical protein